MLLSRRLLFMIALAGIPSAVVAGPQRTTAVFDDWTLACSYPAEKPRQCEMLSIQTLPGQNTPFGQITINQPDKNAPYDIIIQTPPNASVQTGARFLIDDKDDVVVASFKWCASSRCLAEGKLSKDAIKKIAARNQPTRFTFKDAAENDISVPVSLRGFGAALDAMEAQ
jgi:invasion protein IalB